MILTGNLRYLLKFENEIRIKDVYGSESVTYSHFCFLKCEKIKQYGNKNISNNEIFQENNLIFRSYYRAINSTMRVTYNEEYYKIIGIEERKFDNEMIITIEKINN